MSPARLEDIWKKNEQSLQQVGKKNGIAHFFLKKKKGKKKKKKTSAKFDCLSKHVCISQHLFGTQPTFLS